MKTALTDRFGIEHPVMSAGMARRRPGAARGGGQRGGRHGVPGRRQLSRRCVRDEIRAIRALTAAPFAVNLLVPPSLLDDSVEDWEPVRERWEHLSVEERDKLRGVEPMLTPGAVAHQVEVVLAEQPAAVVLTFDAPAWFVTECHERGIAVFCLVGSVSRAAQAEVAGADSSWPRERRAAGTPGTSARWCSYRPWSTRFVSRCSPPEGSSTAGGWRRRDVSACTGCGWDALRRQHRGLRPSGLQATGGRRREQAHDVVACVHRQATANLRNRWTDQWEGRNDEIAAFPEQYAVAGVRVESGYQDGDVDEGMMPAGSGRRGRARDPACGRDRSPRRGRRRGDPCRRWRLTDSQPANVSAAAMR